MSEHIKNLGRELRDGVMGHMQPGPGASAPTVPFHSHPMTLRPGTQHTREVPDNQTMFQGFEWYVPADHQHWNRLANVIPGLAALGITTMWIPPACKAGWHDTNGYDTYDLYDLGEFDQKGGRHTKWGTKEELVAMAETANAHGVKVLFDAVLNHKAAADFSEELMATKVASKDRTKVVSEPELIQAWTGYNFHGRGDTYSPLKWNKSHFTGIDYNDKAKTKGVWKFEGKEWAPDVDEENGNYDYLMFADVDHKHPEVRRDIFNWVQWLSCQVRLGGLRMDAIKHYSAEFLRDFIRHVDHTVGRDWFIVGEYWREDSEVLARYIEFMNHRISLFDVRLLNNFSRMSLQNNADLRTVFDGTLAAIKPANAVTFVANHDTMQGQSLEAPIVPFFIPLAYALILLRNDTGTPCVFYGDLYGHPNPSDRNKFIAPPFGSTQLPKLILTRKLYAYGHQTDYFNEPHCIGWTRSGEPAAGPRSSQAAGLAVVINNGREFATKRMHVGRQHASARWWTDILKSCWGRVLIDDDGWASFPVGPRSVAVWTNEFATDRNLVDSLVFDRDIYRLGLKEDLITANHLYQPRLQTTPAWMGIDDELRN